MISKANLNKHVRSTRTYKFKVRTSFALQSKFEQLQDVQRLYFNYSLKYMYQHYGIGHLYIWPSTPQYLVKNCKAFARAKALTHGFSLKDMDINIQATDKMLEQLWANFDTYRKGQRQARHWSDETRDKYLREHVCNITGYGRIKYKHDAEDIRSVTLKKNSNRIFLHNTYSIELPCFKTVKTYKSMNNILHKDIQEARIVHRPNGNFELQVVVKFENIKQLSRRDSDNIVGLDVNMKDNKFFALSTGKTLTWTKHVAHQYAMLDSKSRRLNKEIRKHNKGRDNSIALAKLNKQNAKIKARMSYIIDNWQLQVAKQLSAEHNVLAIEQLNSFDLRMSKRYNQRFRKNVNNKLAKIQPTSFRTIMECVYQNDGHLLLEVNSIDTSKTCNNCGYINHGLTIKERQWQCPECDAILNRDLNATYNIRDWAIDVNKHAVLKQQPDRFKYLKKSDLVKVY
jgi:putative transposase